MTDSVSSCSRCGYASKYNINNHIKRKNMCKPLLNNEPPTITTKTKVLTEENNNTEDDGISDLTCMAHGHKFIINMLQFAKIRANDEVSLNAEGPDPDNLRITIQIDTETETRLYINISRSECIKYRDFIKDMSSKHSPNEIYQMAKTVVENKQNINY